MLLDIYPKLHRRYSSLPLFGSLVEGFGGWLLEHGYHRDLVRTHLRSTLRLDLRLRNLGCERLPEVTRGRLRGCAPKDSQDDTGLASAVRLWERFLDERHLLPESEVTATNSLTAEYRAYLERVRGASHSTLHQHGWTASHFLVHIGYDAHPSCLAKLGQDDIEQYIRLRGQRSTRGSLQHEIACLRSFLRFLAGRGDARPGLDEQIDTPRLYRGEQLPRSLPWDTVQAFLHSIDRKSSMGVRDYAIFLMIATYGLRASELVTLKLDDIEWRSRILRVHQRKTGSPLPLPLTDAVGQSLVAYLRRARPQSPRREVFLRCRAPAGLLRPTAITEAFQRWTKHGRLSIPFQGAHCLRHSYAVHLLRQGVSLETIGDLLGHRNAESTCVYIRLAVEDLRGVALNLPSSRPHPRTAEDQS